MPTSFNLYQSYRLHYERMSNLPPDWEAAERGPEAFALDNPWFVAFVNRPWLPSDKKAKILDLGCGWGHQLLALWHAGYHRIEGVDLVAEQVETCNEGAAGRFQVHCIGGIEVLSDKIDVYDLVILNDVIEHVPVPEAVPLLRAVFQALVPGGCVVLRTPNMSTILAMYSRYIDLTHLTGYTEFSIQQLLDQAGFEDHCFVPDNYGINRQSWRPWIPWRGLGIRCFLNRCLHRIVYWLREQGNTPAIFDYNLEVYSHKPSESK